jgi:hypothetical protein
MLDSKVMKSTVTGIYTTVYQTTISLASDSLAAKQ